MKPNRKTTALVAVLAMLLPILSWAEQMQKLGDWEVHYVLIPTTFLKAEIASAYGVPRARDRALLNVSVLDADQQPTRVNVDGHVTNLLGQRQPLIFAEIQEGSAVYYLATVKHTDQEVLRFEVQIQAPGDSTRTLRFQQKVYTDRK